MKLSAVWLASILVASGSVASAQRAAPASVGPGRIVCNASFCELGVGPRPVQRIRVIASVLPEDDTRRLRKCTGVAPPCMVTVDGLEQGDKTRIMATRIVWQE
nr:hypothetical protein [uncultured Rhodopila sp.]